MTITQEEALAVILMTCDEADLKPYRPRMYIPATDAVIPRYVSTHMLRFIIKQTMPAPESEENRT